MTATSEVNGKKQIWDEKNQKWIDAIPDCQSCPFDWLIKEKCPIRHENFVGATSAADCVVKFYKNGFFRDEIIAKFQEQAEITLNIVEEKQKKIFAMTLAIEKLELKLLTVLDKLDGLLKRSIEVDDGLALMQRDISSARAEIEESK